MGDRPSRLIEVEGGRAGWRIAPYYFYIPGSGALANGHAAPIHFTDEECSFRISALALKILLKQEQHMPGSLKKGLSWLAPFPEPPCWHQIEAIKMEPHGPHGAKIAITLKLGEAECQAHGLE